VPEGYQVVLVDYNPIKGRSFNSIINSQTKANLKILSVTGNEVSRLATESQPFVEYHAKNIGVQFAQGSQVLVINTDTIISKSLIRACVDRPYADDSFLRADRTDVMLGRKTKLPRFVVQVRNGTFESNPISVKFPNKNFFKSSQAFQGEEKEGKFLITPKGGLPDHFLGGAHGNASGDFICAPKWAWDKIKGYSESKYQTHMGDAYIISGFFSLGMRQVIARGVFRLLHINHSKPIDYWVDWSEEDWSQFKKEFKDIQLRVKPYPTENRL
jgi:hypothetical protein